MIQEPLDAPPEESKYVRSLILKVICILILVISLLQIAGTFYATQFKSDGYENQWTIFFDGNTIREYSLRSRILVFETVGIFSLSC